MSRASLETNNRVARLVSVVATAWAVVYPVWLALAYRPGAPRPVVAEVAFVPMNVMFAAVAGLVAVRPADSRLRRAFVLLAMTWVAIVAGNICKFIFVEIHPLVDWSACWWVNLPFL